MSSISLAAQRRRSCLLATTFLIPVLSFGVSAANAQQIAQALPPIEITSPDENRTRAKPKIDQEQSSRRVVPNVAPTRRPSAAPAGGVPATSVPAVQQFRGHQHANAAHPLGRLSVRRQRQGRRTAECRDEVAPSHARSNSL